MIHEQTPRYKPVKFDVLYVSAADVEEKTHFKDAVIEIYRSKQIKCKNKIRRMIYAQTPKIKPSEYRQE